MIRRFLMPFWAFYKHSAKVLAKTPFDHPAKSNFLTQLERINSEITQELPPWMAGPTELGPGDQPGETMYLNRAPQTPWVP